MKKKPNGFVSVLLALCLLLAPMTVFAESNAPVSYTHLTLPTKRIVEISVVAVPLQKKKKNKTEQHTYDGQTANKESTSRGAARY